jgi:hypothetical protein
VDFIGWEGRIPRDIGHEPHQVRREFRARVAESGSPT